MLSLLEASKILKIIRRSPICAIFETIKILFFTVLGEIKKENKDFGGIIMLISFITWLKNNM